MSFFSKNRNIFILSFFLVFFVFGILFSVGEVLAQSSDIYGIGSVENSSLALSGGDIRVVAAKIIRVVLGLLGIILLGIILYGGYVFMTAGGSEEKITQARKILINGVIGLAIIMSAFTIVSFVINSLSSATGVYIPPTGKNSCSYCTDFIDHPNFASENVDFCGQCRKNPPFFCEDEYFLLKV